MRRSERPVFVLVPNLDSDDSYTLLVLSEQSRLTTESVIAIKRHIKDGGRLLATGTTRYAGLVE